jgi:hypothetical protein
MIIIIIISLPRLRPSGLLLSHASFWWGGISPKIFAYLVSNGEFGMGFLKNLKKKVFQVTSVIFFEFHD